jgi:transposase
MATDRSQARRRAAILFAQGVSRAEVARAVGVSRATTTRWHRLWEEGGETALLLSARRGRPPRLDPRALERIEGALLRPPRASGYDLDQWSLAAVAALVEKLTGVGHHRRHAPRLMRRMGWIVPPVGASAKDALRRKLLRDPDGNVLGLLERRPRTAARGGGT